MPRDGTMDMAIAVEARLPGGTWIESALKAASVCLALVVGLVVVDAFGASSQLGRAGAFGFWTTLVCLNVAGWSAWRRLVGPRAVLGARLLVGGVVLNALLAVEVAALYRAMGREDATFAWRPFVYGLVVTGFLAFYRRAGRSSVLRGRSAVVTCSDAAPFVVPVEAGGPPPRRATAGILARAGLADATELMMVRAEDHYCRLILRGGRSRLVLYRFADAVAELSGEDGAQVRRGVWVAVQAVVGGRREGRRWSLELRDGAVVPVGETSVTVCRARGWLNDRAGSA